MDILDKLLESLQNVDRSLMDIDLMDIGMCRGVLKRCQRYVGRLLDGVHTAIEFQNEFSDIDFVSLVNLRMDLIEWLNRLVDYLLEFRKCLESYGISTSIGIVDKSISIVIDMLKVFQNA